MPESSGKSVAVLIDYENVFIEFRKKIKPQEPINWEAVLESIKRYGSLMVCKAYSDWSGNGGMQDRFSKMGVEAITVPSKRNGRNSVDVRMAVDAIDILVVKNNNIGVLALVSGDGDFTALVNYLKPYGKFVVGIGVKGATAEYLESACHEYKYLASKSELVDADQAPAPEPKEPPPDAIESDIRAEQKKDKEDEARDPDNPNDPFVREYSEILSRRGIRIMPLGDRELTIKESFQLLRQNPGKRLDEIKDIIIGHFQKNYPEVDKGLVNNFIRQISDANCLEFDKPMSGFAEPLPQSERRVFLRDFFKTPIGLMQIMDKFLVNTIKSESGFKEINCEALSTVLYGASRQPELVQWVKRLVDRSAKSTQD
jgi:uncharacterized protein (TIGR00288 family)